MNFLSPGFSEITPSLEFEKTRRQVGRGIQETWWYLSDQLRQLRKKVEAFSDYTAHIDKVMNEGSNHFRFVSLVFIKLIKLLILILNF